MQDFIIRRRTTEKGASFALAVSDSTFSLTPHSKLLTFQRSSKSATSIP